ncbi:MAG: hypothetical protein HFI63_07865 [Lachnospiraceae bacterium]|nr:hypothetical protein [Lachnospiraceae bacterium]
MKKRYLCPVCDQELTAKSYCPECRRIRREPIVYEGWLLPNESDHEGLLQRAAEERAAAEKRDSVRRPDGQTKAAVSGKGTAAKGQVTGGRVYDSRYADACGSSHTHTYGVPNTDPHKKKSGGTSSSRVVSVFVVVILMAIAVAAFWDPVKELAGEIAGGFKEAFGEETSKDLALEVGEAGEDFTGTEAFETEPGDSTDGSAILSEEEVLEAGEPCNGYNHYDVEGTAYTERLSAYMKELWNGETPSVEWMESDNRVYRSGSDSYSYYERDAQIVLENGVYYRITCDTVTGEVMEIAIGTDTEEEFRQALLLAACALEPERDRNELWQEVGEVVAEAEGEEYYFGEWGISVLYISGGQSYYGSLTCLPQYDKYQ